MAFVSKTCLNNSLAPAFNLVNDAAIQDNHDYGLPEVKATM